MPKIDWRGRQVDAVEMDFQTRREDWSEYQLYDGTVLKMKTAVGEILRIEGEYDPEGNPVYQVKSTNVMMVRSPDQLKKKD